MVKRLKVVHGTYRDSISLLRISDEAAKLPGVSQAAVVMATPLNKKVLADAGLGGTGLESAGTDDLVVAVEADTASRLEAALASIDAHLQGSERAPEQALMPKSLAEALQLMPDANLVMISTPGSFAKREAMGALRSGLNVFMFSSNVPRADERELKMLARRKHLLMMGPDCGTSIINHVVLGFGNVVRAGNIGLISASGTGLQAVSVMIDRAGMGISQAIGTGGGDLSDQVGGIMTVEALKLLERDDQTKVIVLISKPPGVRTAKRVLAQAAACRKPVVVSFLGARTADPTLPKGRVALTLDEAALTACRLAGGRGSRGAAQRKLAKALALETAKLAPSQKYVRGLYAGGTLCYEAQVVLRPLVGKVYSNVPIEPGQKIDGYERSTGNSCIDLGAEEFVVGRAHPMIDFTIRKRRILDEASDPETAVLLLDVELGIGSNPDPAGELSPAIAKARAVAEREGRHLSVVASVIGTRGDFQGLAGQEKILGESGVVVAGSNAEASRISAAIALRGKATAYLRGSA